MNKTSEGGRPAVDYEVTIDMAEQICMIQRTEKENLCRFFRVEILKYIELFMVIQLLIFTG